MEDFKPHSGEVTPDHPDPRPQFLHQDLDPPGASADQQQGPRTGGADSPSPRRAEQELQATEPELSGPRRGSGAVLVQDLKQDQPDSVDGVPLQDPHLVLGQDQDYNQDLQTNQDVAFPALVVTMAADERIQATSAALRTPPTTPAAPGGATDLSFGSVSVGGDMSCSDLLSQRSDSFSASSEAAASRRSEEDDTRSVAASSVMSLFHRLQLDPLEKDWLRCSALGDVDLQRQLLGQEPGLVFKKDFVSTALHWAAKQGRQDSVDLMLHYGVDINVRSGYTALHLASIHRHQHLVRRLIYTHNAKTTIRDYHGKMAAHYWSGCSEVFNKPQSLPGGGLSGGRRSQRHILPSRLLTRSRSHGHLNLDFGAPPQSASHNTLDLYV